MAVQSTETTRENPAHAEGGAATDSLLACLLDMARRNGVSVSPQSLLAGLPLPESGRLTPALFVRAAERAGMAAALHLRKLDAVPELALPVVLLLKDGGACLLVARKGGFARVVFPDLGEGEATIPFEELAARYQGRLVYVKPEPGGKAAPRFRPGPEHRAWFWDVVRLMRAEYAMTIVAAASINVIALAIPLFTMNVYDRVLPNGAFPTLWVLAIGVVIALGFDFALRALRGVFIDVAGRRIDILLSSQMFEHLLDMRLAARPRNAGELANRLKDFEIVREFFTSSTVATLTDILFMALFLAVIAWIGGLIALVPLAAILAVIAIGLAVQPALKRNLEQADREAALKHGHLVETIAALEAVKSLNAQGQLQRLWDRIVAASATTFRETRMLSLLALNAASFVQQMTTVFIIVMGAYLFAERAISMGAIIACVMLAARAVAPLGNVAHMFVRLQQARVAFRGLDVFMAQPTETQGAPARLHRRVEAGEIAFREVSFTYPGAAAAALDGISLRVAPGERVAVLGRVGSGKTTLSRLLLGLYEPSAGAVLVDGVDVRQYHPAELRRGIGVVLQDVTLFSGTVRQNIAFGVAAAEDSAVLRAARLAGADDFIREHPQGYEAEVGERGMALSGGQRQAIALARALFHDPPVLFLDEPTSALDPRFEADFVRRMMQVLARRPRTLVVSTHRRSLLALVERVIVLERGRILADGPKDKVLEKLQAMGAP